MRRFRFIAGILWTCLVAVPARGADLPKPDVIAYPSGSLSLKGYLYKPDGPGPFPVYLWNHGSEKYPGPAGTVAKFWTDHGFVFFKPIRSGHGGNPGSYIVDEEKAAHDGVGKKEAFQQVAKLHEAANDDVVA